MFLAKFLLTPFAFLTYLLFPAINENIFDFDPAKPLIISPLNSLFILPITFLLAGSKNFEYCG